MCWSSFVTLILNKLSSGGHNGPAAFAAAIAIAGHRHCRFSRLNTYGGSEFLLDRPCYLDNFVYNLSKKIS